ncbi:hypothetical protein SAMN03080617_00871 [Algoriphagus alkaliphilus]|uniref:Uncharacterized protein n=1 Tax=Algoriphagus alkaliphilus TaxID=279824 RepID=A0A1G5W3T7_9BACT|nr:hypothetical protein SAMN03080617_00871 [Algoriphagus alkaliphilus]
MTGGYALKSFEVSRKLPDELVVFANDIIFCLGHDKGDLHRILVLSFKIPVFGMEKMKKGSFSALFWNYLSTPAIIFGNSAMVYFRGLFVSISMTFMSVIDPSVAVKIISIKLPLGAFENMELY